MQIKETLSQGLKRQYEVVVPAKELKEKITVQLETLGKKVKVPGFRPGKVPLPLLKQRYNNDALSKVLEDCVEKGAQQIIKENNLKPALKPKVDIVSFDEEKDLTFKVNLEILPVINDIKLDKLSFERFVIKVPEKEITDFIERLAKQSRETHPLKTSRKTKRGDIVILDFEGFIDNKPIEGGAGKDHKLELGSNSFIPGFEEQLIGQEKGAELDVKLTFPKEYHATEYANKPARFHVKVTDIHEVHPIIIDAKLAKKIGFETVKEMKEFVEKNISQNYESKSFINTKRQVLDALAERFPFEVPPSMVELEFEGIWKQLCKELGIDESSAANANAEGKVGAKEFKETTGRSEAELRKEYKLIAERRVRLGILLAEIGNRNKITVTQQELLNALNARAREFSGQEKEVFDFYRSNDSAMASLRAPIFENKVIEYILSETKVTEKTITPEDLEKQLILEEEKAEKKLTSDAKKTNKETKKKDT